MFNDISWGNYFISVFILLTAYYLVIIFRFYREHILQLLSGKPLPENEVPSSTTSHQYKLQDAFENQDQYPSARSLSDEIQAFFKAGQDLSKEQIIQSLKLLLAKYPGIHESSFKDGIESLIQTECKNNCSVHLSEDEVSGLW